MFIITTPRSLLGAAIAACLLLASPALAKPVDVVTRTASPTSSLAGTVSPGQDLRGEHARDAALAVTQAAPKQDLRGEHARDAARPAPIRATPVATDPAPARSAPDAGTDTDTGGIDTWLVVLLAATGAAIAAAGTAGAVRLRRTA